MTDTPRLIEHAFPLKQASLDSVHEKNVRHGHISTLHIWPARRPLAACRAALIATLLPDPSAQPKPDGMSDEEWHKDIIRQRQELCEKIGGRIVKKIEKKRMPNGQVVEREKEVTEGGILHWGREAENKETLDWFRKEIRKAYGGRAPKMLDPFAGGGAIPLEAMRLGCEATAVDINPVAWFILKCTLEYPQKLAGKTWPLPGFILQNEAFMREFLEKAKGLSKGQMTKALEQLGRPLKKGEQAPLDLEAGREVSTDADLAWHVRAWGQWVLDRARRELAGYYPTYADFEPLDKHNPRPYEKQPMRLVPLKEDGTPDADALNAEFSSEYLADKRNPRWVAKPTVAYLWARTVTCKNCRTTIPLLKTRWLCKMERKRVLLTMEVKEGSTGVVFGIEHDVSIKGSNTAQRRENDKRLGSGTMTRSGARCPCCFAIMTKQDIQVLGQQQSLAETMCVAVTDSGIGRSFRTITSDDWNAWAAAVNRSHALNATDRFGGIALPIDPRRPSPNARGLSGLTRYGIGSFDRVFNERQQVGLFTYAHLIGDLQELVQSYCHDEALGLAICDTLSLLLGKLADYNSKGCTWNIGRQGIGHTFTRFALPMTTDYAEVSLVMDTGGGFASATAFIIACLEYLVVWTADAPSPIVQCRSATDAVKEAVDVILTDPPYYDAIPYADISDYFYIWLRRATGYRHPSAFGTRLVPRNEEIVQHAGRMDGDNEKARIHYEGRMVEAFKCFQQSLSEAGRLVLVFAHKQPEAWEALASALMRSGFEVNASWPVQTERDTRFTSLGGAALASSVWLVCKRRPSAAKPGWDNQVLEEMRQNIRDRLQEFWDAGIRGPDFVWAATGPALEAYSKHPVVKKVNDPGQVMTVSEFLGHVRRIVVDYVVGRVLSGDGAVSSEEVVADRLDEPTAYYLLHRHDFGMNEAPAGACILYAISCGISDKELASTWDLIGFTKGDSAEDEEDAEVADEEADPDAEEESGSKVRLKTWAQRKGSSLGYEAPSGKQVPLIDRVHRLMHLWRGGDLHKVDEYLDGNGLRRQELFKRLLQSLIELSPHGSEERSLLESLSNHLQAKGTVAADQQLGLSV